MIEYRDYITRDMLQSEPSVLFVFGDNFARMGYGGQAKEMRGEINAIGIPTKRSPTMKESGFLKDNDFMEWAEESGISICLLIYHDGLIVWPSAGIGTGLAQLPQRAPRIWKVIERLRLSLEKYPEVPNEKP